VTLTEFLLARIAEDEAVAEAVPEPLIARDTFDVRFSTFESDHSRADEEFVRRFDPARVLAECVAKRRIVLLHGIPGDGTFDDPCDYFPGCDTLRILAAVYANHPDYREEWRA
jgi:hypothetical protein